MHAWEWWLECLHLRVRRILCRHWVSRGVQGVVNSPAHCYDLSAFGTETLPGFRLNLVKDRSALFQIGLFPGAVFRGVVDFQGRCLFSLFVVCGFLRVPLSHTRPHGGHDLLVIDVYRSPAHYRISVFLYREFRE